ncbi:chaperone modulator CbpM [Frigoriflavimonas asaccharolytica]|uniref:MerR-like DNA binding protein n=1 Tax=Frigoriflavimonas asaccharolytica TaxID=2735899 RepID=A0A8J8GBD6_9FLAO|nr:chaperone modulator CbpM [Frigoriflavimonas asaccharolytica]NRS93104.1 hypothetical protein [Frigoriflavimonas asaccharolytica]
MENKISREELIKIYKVEITFFDRLEECGLLQTIEENNTKYLLFEEINNFEKFANFHYDLEINLPGLEVIHQLLQQIKLLQSENISLQNRANLPEYFEDF